MGHNVSKPPHPRPGAKGVSLASLQHLEKVFGTLVCALLHLPARLAPRAAHVDGARVRRVLVIKFWGIGSLVLAEPFFRAARKRFPNAEIHVLTLASNRAVADLIGGDIDAFRFVDLGASMPSAIWAYAKTLWRVFRADYDVVIDMEFYTRASAVVSLAAWAPVRIGYHAQGIYRGAIQTHRIPFNGYWHVSHNFLSLLEPFNETLGVLPDDVVDVPRLALPPDLGTSAQAVLQRIGGESKARYIVINVNAGELAYERRWFPDRFAALAARLSTAFDLDCLFIGGASERAYVDGVVADAAAQGARAHNVAGDLDLLGLAQICAGSRLVISNDSGPLHVAAASGAPVVGFFGPETPVLYGPAGEGHLVFHESMSCSPCINAEQGKRIKCRFDVPKCQMATTVETAYAQIVDRFAARLDAPARTKTPKNGTFAS